MLLEQLCGVVAKARMQFVQLARSGEIGAHFEEDVFPFRRRAPEEPC
jgi:hypothetical protein